MIHKGKGYTLHLGNSLEVLDTLADNSIDSIVTDPPYEIGFMGKGWDSTGIAFNVEIWKKCLRVLKPGGHLVAFNHSRMFHRMMVAIEDAGFEIRDTIMWLYGSGFPKSLNIGKAVDKLGERTTEIDKEISNYLKEKRLELKLSIKDVEIKLGWNTWLNWIEGRNYNGKFIIQIPTYEDYLKLKRLYNLDDRYDEIIKQKEREVIGSQITNKTLYQNIGQGSISGEIEITKGNSQWEGWGTALKPAYEPIVLARKPILEQNIAQNVLKWGVGGINIDECRIETKEDLSNVKVFGSMPKGIDGWQRPFMKDKQNIKEKQERAIEKLKQLGRFPANIIHDGSEEVVSGFPNEDYEIGGSPSRFFYTAKASQEDRNEGLEIAKFQESVVNDGRKKSIDNAYQRGETKRLNTHPTVKPTDLMRYLVRLITPNGGTCLDLFMGSGSTGKALVLENAHNNKNYHFIGIDMTPEYVEIAKARIEYAINNPFNEAKVVEVDGNKVLDKPISLFDD